MHGGSWAFAGVFGADEGGVLLTSSGSRRPTRSSTCFAQSSPAEWREGRGRGGRRERRGVSVEKSRRVGPADCCQDCPDYKLPGLSRRRWPLSQPGSDIISAGPPPPRLPEGGSEPTRVAARPLTPHMFHTFVNKNSNVVKVCLFIDIKSSKVVGGARPPLARRFCCAAAGGPAVWRVEPSPPGPVRMGGPPGLGLAAGGRGYCTGTGPGWGGQEGTAGVRAGTSWALSPAAPVPRPTGASTWS